MFPNTKLKHLFFWTIELLALSILVYLLLGFDFLMRPIKVFISTVFVPLVVAGFLYYVLTVSYTHLTLPTTERV